MTRRLHFPTCRRAFRRSDKLSIMSTGCKAAPPGTQLVGGHVGNSGIPILRARNSLLSCHPGWAPPKPFLHKPARPASQVTKCCSKHRHNIHRQPMLWLVLTIVIAIGLFRLAKQKAIDKAKIKNEGPPTDSALVGIAASSAVFGFVLAAVPAGLISAAFSDGKPAPTTGSSSIGPPSWERSASTANDALSICQSRLRSAARIDAVSVDVPSVPNYGSGGEFYYAWGGQTQFISIKTRDGSARASGSCIIGDGRVKALPLNGKTII